MPFHQGPVKVIYNTQFVFYTTHFFVIIACSERKAKGEARGIGEAEDGNDFKQCAHSNKNNSFASLCIYFIFFNLVQFQSHGDIEDEEILRHARRHLRECQKNEVCFFTFIC